MSFPFFITLTCTYSELEAFQGAEFLMFDSPIAFPIVYEFSYAFVNLTKDALMTKA